MSHFDTRLDIKSVDISYDVLSKKRIELFQKRAELKRKEAGQLRISHQATISFFNNLVDYYKSEASTEEKHKKRFELLSELHSIRLK